ncbi:MAG: OmpA family protein, partial [Nitrospiraceae bacterium]
PGTPAGVTVDKNGCPLDSDGDGVPDYLDKCPDTPRGTAVDANGCPPSVTLDNIYFDFNKATLTDAAKDSLNKNISTMKDNPGVTIRIAGHACAHGPEDYNLRMSELRANAVKEYFVTEGGIAEERISTIAYGESRLALPEEPTPENKNSHEAQANRRVEFTVTEQ